MLITGEKILVTGPAGQIAFPLAASLATANEVWGIARFTDPATRRRVEDIGVKTLRCDLAESLPDSLPSDFTYVLHLAVFSAAAADYDHAMSVNAEATGLLLQHCRKARAALVMSTHAVYKPNPDPLHAYKESDPLGDANPPYSPTYSISKIGQEAVARFAARAFDLPLVIARMNASYGPWGGLPMRHFDQMLQGKPVVAKADPLAYSPIHQDDINSQVEALLDAASVPGLIVNWAGDEVVSVQEWCAFMSQACSVPYAIEVQPVVGSQVGLAADASRRQSITGQCAVPWRAGLKRAIAERHPEVAQEPSAQAPPLDEGSASE